MKQFKRQKETDTHLYGRGTGGTLQWLFLKGHKIMRVRPEVKALQRFRFFIWRMH